jgi:hypothetical protein
MKTATKKRYFEVIINGNFFFPAHTLEVKNEKIAVNKAAKEAKIEGNSTIDVIEVDNNGNCLEDGFVSGTIKIEAQIYV